MYLSLLILNLRSRQVQSELASPYEMHRTIMQAYPDGKGRDDAGVLFRLDMDARTGLPTLLVQSLIEPNWHVLNKDYLIQNDKPNPMVKEYRPLLRKGQVLAFRLRANPTVKREGKRQALYKDEDQLTWLTRKSANHGFKILQVSTSQQDKLTSELHGGSGASDLTLFSVRYDGVLQVSDSKVLHESLEKGIGSGKAFGFGLLSLAKPA